MRTTLASRVAGRAGQAAGLALALGLVFGWQVPAGAEAVPDFALIGARARAMGGAYLAVADGVESMAWNPAGIAAVDRPQLTADTGLEFGSGRVTKGIDIFTGGAAPAPVVSFDDSPQSRFTYFLLAGAAPSPFVGWSQDYGLTGAFGYRRVINGLFGQSQLLQFDSGGGFSIPFEHIDEGEGGVDAWTLSLAGRPERRVALGVNVNFLTGFSSDLDQQRVAFQGQEFFLLENRVRYLFSGLSFDLGATIRPVPELALSGVLRPGYDLEQEGKSGSSRLFVLPGAGLPPADTLITYKAADITNEVPLTYGLGAAYTLQQSPLKGLLVAADYQYRPWNELKSLVHTDAGLVEVENLRYPTHSIHVGGEYVFNREGEVSVPVRLGFHTTPTQAANVDSLSAEIGAGRFRNFRGDRVETHTWALGLGIHFPTVAFDVSLDFSTYEFSEFLFDNVPPPGVQLDIIGVEESLRNLYLSTTLRF